jgi:transposase-like protein
VWLYYRFCLSYRDVEELLFARGITRAAVTVRRPLGRRVPTNKMRTLSHVGAVKRL